MGGLGNFKKKVVNNFLTLGGFKPLFYQENPTFFEEITRHTSLEATLRKIKLFKQSANAGVSKKPIQKFCDVSQLFWMGDFGDIPQNLTFF